MFTSKKATTGRKFRQDRQDFQDFLFFHFEFPEEIQNTKSLREKTLYG